VAEFLGQPKINFVPAALSANRGDGVTLSLLDGAHSLDLPVSLKEETGARVELGVRPDAVKLCEPSAGDLRARVELVEHLGSESIVYAEVEHLPDLITVVAPGKSQLRRGEAVGLKIDPTTCH